MNFRCLCWQESSLPDILTENSWVSPNATTRSRSNGKSPTEHTRQNAVAPSSCEHRSEISPSHYIMEENHIQSLMTCQTDEANQETAFDMAGISDQLGKDILPEDSMEEEEKTGSTSPESSTSVGYVYSCTDFVDSDDVSIPSISVTLAPFYRGTQKIQILHRNFPLQLQCTHLKVRFGISTKFVDHAGRPRLSIVVDASPSLCKILDAIDNIAQKLFVDSGSSSEWRPVVTRKTGFFNSPTFRLQ